MSETPLLDFGVPSPRVLHDIRKVGPTGAPIVPCHPSVPAEESPRLSSQNAAILARLQRGPATNTELAAIALKYTSRISDLRDAGYDVFVLSRDRMTGVVVYVLHRKDE